MTRRAGAHAVDGFEQLGRTGFARKWLGTILSAYRSRPDRNDLQALVSRSRRNGGLLREPVFVVGSPRSGTSLVGRILGAIPGNCYFREPAIGKYYVRSLYEREVTLEEAEAFYRRLYSTLMLANRGKGRFIEKNPCNIFIIKHLKVFFPDAKFVLVVRDGRDVACSLLSKPWHLRKSLADSTRDHSNYRAGPYPHYYIEKRRFSEYFETSDIHRCIWIWRRHVEAGLEAKESLPTEDIYVLRYEHLVTDPKRELGLLLRFLGPVNGSADVKAILEKAGSPHPGSVGRWSKELDSADLMQVYGEASSCLKVLGYLE